MAEPSRYPDSTPPTRPRWVKVLGIIVLVVVLLAIIVMVAGGGEHGPGRHTGGAGTGLGSDRGSTVSAAAETRPASNGGLSTRG